jgi:hypothetical protein
MSFFFFRNIYLFIYFIFKNYLFTRPRGPNLGARVAAGPGSEPKTLILTKIKNYF